MDLRNGLASKIDIKHGDSVFSQTLDYVGIPFKCNRCHNYGHLVSHCHLSFNRNYRDEIKPKTVWRVKKHVIPFVDLYDPGLNSVSPRGEGLDVYFGGNPEHIKACIQSLKPLSLPYQGVMNTVGKSEVGFIYPLRNLEFMSPIKKTIHGTGYFLRSYTK